MSRVRIYRFSDWNQTAGRYEGLEYRPSVRTLIRRLGFALVAAVASAALYWGNHNLQARRATHDLKSDAQIVAATQDQADSLIEQMRSSLTPEEFEAFQEQLADRASEVARKRAQVEREDRYLEWAYHIVFTAIVTVGVLPSLLTLWEKIRITRDRSGHLTIRRIALWPTDLSVPIHEYGAIAVSAEEYLHGKRRVGFMWSEYRWKVQLVPRALGTSKRSALIIFEPDSQRSRPIEQMPIPVRVSKFVDSLKAMTGLEVTGPVIADRSLSKGAIGVRRRPRIRVSATIGMPHVETTTQTFGLDDAPPEIRALMDDLQAEAKRTGKDFASKEFVLDQRITFRDSDGTTRTYRSPEEMPPEVRAVFERMRRMGK